MLGEPCPCLGEVDLSAETAREYQSLLIDSPPRRAMANRCRGSLFAHFAIDGNKIAEPPI
jgi:hypothetical protein